MNLSTIALILLAWQLLAPDRQRQNVAQPQLQDMLSDEVKSILDSAQKLSKPDCSQEEKAGAIFEIFANPAMQQWAGALFGQGHPQEAQETKSDNQPQEAQQAAQAAQTEHVNEEGYRFETPSQASQEFFRPIDNIADVEIKHKLYWFYDNWYTK